MAHTLPLRILTDVRLVFRQCVPQHKFSYCRYVGSAQSKQCQVTSDRKYSRRARNTPAHNLTGTRKEDKHGVELSGAAESKESSRSPIPHQQTQQLVPGRRDGRAVGTTRTVDAPMKIIPKADLTPNLKLTPKERLHIEILTRRPPPVVKQAKPYKERLLIYHQGNFHDTALLFAKVLPLAFAGVATMIVVPAHYFAGTALWLCGSMFLMGWAPALLMHYFLKPMVTRVHLRLPPNARLSPVSAMNYAKSLPPSAQLDVSFQRITTLPGTVTALLSDLHFIPASSRRLGHLPNIEWTGEGVDKGSRWRPNPTLFFFKPTVGPGKAKRDVIPGIWTEVYSRLTGATATKEQASKWKQSI